MGAGAWGRNIIATIARLDGARLTHLVTSRPENRSLVGADCAIVSDVSSILSTDHLDGLIVAVPPTAQPDIVLAALDAGIPVFAEKPLALDVSAARRMAERAREKQIPLIVDHIHLFNPAFRALCKQLTNMGRIEAINSEAGRHGPFREGFSVLWDWGPHDVAMCIAVLGRPPSICAARALPGDGEGATIEITLTFDDVIARSVISNRLPEKRRCFEVLCDSGDLLFDDLATDKLTRRDDDREPTSRHAVAVPTTLPLDVALSDFSQSVRTRTFDVAGVDLAVEVVRTLAACEQALSS